VTELESIYAEWVAYAVKNLPDYFNRWKEIDWEGILKTITDKVKEVPPQEEIRDTEVASMPLSHGEYHDLFYTGLLNAGVVQRVTNALPLRGKIGFLLERGMIDVCSQSGGCYGLGAKGGIIIARGPGQVGDGATGGIFVNTNGDECPGCTASKGAYFIQQQNSRWVIAEGHGEWRGGIGERAERLWWTYYHRFYYKPRIGVDKQLVKLVEALQKTCTHKELLPLCVELDNPCGDLVTSYKS